MTELTVLTIFLLAWYVPTSLNLLFGFGVLEFLQRRGWAGEDEPSKAMLDKSMRCWFLLSPLGPLLWVALVIAAVVLWVDSKREGRG